MDGSWKNTVLEDPQSNVFHKALILPGKSGNAIVTIGAMAASLKIWQVKDKAWTQAVLWNPVFGGTWDRLRDIEVGDVTDDGLEDLVIATHDQGVIAVALQKQNGWQIREIDRAPGIFVHEVEIGDVDGDGKNEFFATPSFPNKAAGGPQPGDILMFSWNGSGFTKTFVDRMEKTHAKEILVCAIDNATKATLFSVAEAETKKENGATVRTEPVKIIQYAFQNGSFTGTVIATLDDFQCRFLTAGDIDGDLSLIHI